MRYQYSPITKPGSFRVVVLHPGSGSEAQAQGATTCLLFADLVHQNLSKVNDEDEDLSYTALSYVWGNPKETRSIFLGPDRQSLEIGINLYNALCDLRRGDRSVRVWADAICINLDDMVERSRQVRQIRDIFFSAQETIVYLGHDDGGNTGVSAWNFLERQSACAADATTHRSLAYQGAFQGDMSDVENDVLERPWFRRVWVFQEVVVSRRISLQCARRRIPWDDFCRVVLFSQRFHDRYGQSLRQHGKANIVGHMFRARRVYLERLGLQERYLPGWHEKVPRLGGADSSYILDVLQMARRLEASDLRDKVYALLGISDGFDAAHPDMEPNYVDTSVEDVYLSVAAHILERSQSYDLFSYLDGLGWCRRRADEDDEDDSDSSPQVPEICSNLESPKAFMVDDEDDSDLPSWVPVWDRSIWGITDVARSFLSILPPESEAVRRRRREIVASSSRRWASSSRVSVVCPGLLLGQVEEPGPIIQLQGQHEQMFQKIQDGTSRSSLEKFREILKVWGWHLARSLPEVARFGEGFDHLATKDLYPPKPGSVESYLLSRSRTTVHWTDDMSKAVAVLYDKESPIDGRKIGWATLASGLAMASSDTEKLGLGIWPSSAKAEDLIVLFEGARVPFLIRMKPTGETGELFKIIGECVVNDFDSSFEGQGYKDGLREFQII